MKKFLSLALSLTMCVTALSAAGCTQDGAQSSTPPPVEQVVEKLQLEKSNLLLTLGDRAELSASYHEIEGATLTWSSSAPNVVSVDENGYVEAMGLGVATITARYGAKQATCLVEVGLSGNVPYLDFENGNMLKKKFKVVMLLTHQYANVPMLKVFCNKNNMYCEQFDVDADKTVAEFIDINASKIKERVDYFESIFNK